ncbi:hypothetical protein [Aquipuribacter nitratireducens]|uniref:DUF4157 domain-containing protein n=1 Tax=Aquipuribacter nitratireducens TaxID=650104 RepID=A0ABW0GND9_9MICO
MTLVPGPHGLLVAPGYPRRFPVTGAAAVTVGEVVLVREGPGLRTLADVARRWPALLDHEARHAAQWARWGGPVGFLPAYAAATVWSWLRTGDRHSANHFERAAGLADGGYRENPPRPLGPALVSLVRGAPARLPALSRGSRGRARPSRRRRRPTAA